MRRADRLFKITQYLRAHKLITARQLAEWLSVSERTVYRDIRDLALSGVPVDGEAGVGYRIRPGHDLPALSFNADEIETLVIGLRMVQAWGGAQLATPATVALAKVTQILPKEQREFIEAAPSLGPCTPSAGRTGEHLEQIRQAIGNRHKLLLQYADAQQAVSQHVVWPLALTFCDGGWTLAAWCEAGEQFQVFRLEWVRQLASHGYYPDRNGRRLADFVRAVRRDENRIST